jgi:HAD superfamily hydrolase (TIGR01493 family)
MSAPRVHVFDAYGTLFDVHAALARHRAAAGPDADRFSEIWRLKQLVSSNRWDVMGAASFGFRAVWVNRAQLPQEYPHQPPVHTVPDLSALPSLVL